MLVSAQRAAHVGMVFQFPERHFLGETLYEVCADGCSCEDDKPLC